MACPFVLGDESYYVNWYCRNCWGAMFRNVVLTIDRRRKKMASMRAFGNGLSD
ncbi:MAG: hypothetical protein ACLU4J_10635 [Butyricimonas paravirosa]